MEFTEFLPRMESPQVGVVVSFLPPTSLPCLLYSRMAQELGDLCVEPRGLDTLGGALPSLTHHSHFALNTTVMRRAPFHYTGRVKKFRGPATQQGKAEAR